MSARIRSFALLLPAFSFLAGCGGKGGGVDHGAPSTVYPAPHAPMAQLVSGGVVEKKPVLISVSFSNDDPAMVASLDDFTAKLKGSAYWSATTSEYGVGAIVSTTAEHLAQAAAASVTDSQIPTDLSNWISSGAVTAPTTDTTYLIYYPANTTITGFGTSCQDYGAYHAWAQIGSANVAYAVIPRCSGFGGSPLDITTLSASHEAVEAATDPTGNGFVGANKDQGIWDLVSFGGEVGDYCEYQPGAFLKPAELGYVVQATWSNAAAAAGHNPCVPAPNPYFMAAPVMPDLANLSFQGTTESTTAVKVPVGTSRTIELDLYSDAATSGPFNVNAVDMATAQGQPAELSFTLDRSSGVNGEKLYLTIKTLKTGTVVPGGSAFFIVTQQGNTQNLWPAWVSD